MEPAAKINELEELSGTIESVVYHNEENGYTVCDMSCSDGELITVVGFMPFVAEGESIKVMGRWEMHGTYGRQFKIEYYEKELPTGRAAILKYLSSRAIKGIGPRTAERIVEAFGDDTFEVMEKNPDFLSQINGISAQKAKEIGEAFKEQFGMRNVMMFTSEYFGTATSVKIYKRWGSAAVDVIKQNPYVLCDQIYGIGFERADKVARSLGFDKNALPRIMAGMKYVLSYNANNNGHVFVPEDKLIKVSADLLGVETDEARDALVRLLESGDLVRVIHKGVSCIYHERYWKAEKYSAMKLDLLDKTAPALDTTDIERFIDQIETENGISYAVMQKKAIMSAVNSGVMVLTGGPGTGKTTVIRAVIRIFERIGYGIALAAPTGRAAKRISESTGREAKTIHRLLEMEFTGDDFPRFRRGEDNLIDEGIIIIDETSMVDTLLLEALLRAIKPGSRLILIGDADQLPSVGAGNVLNDILASERFSTVILKEIFRQAKESRIVTNAHAINAGEYPTLTDKDNDFFFISRENDTEIADTVASLCSTRLPKTYGESIRGEIQVITPSRKGAAGTEALNTRLQAVLNPPSKDKLEKKSKDRVFREGDKVMQIKNNYDIEWQKNGGEGHGIFNGDIGTILSISQRDETLTINFDDRLTKYDFSGLDELEHAWAITIHKSQGSEYPVVIIPAYSYTPKLLTRELFYTAVTRAQKMVIIVGQASAVKMMVDNSRRPKRYTGLKYLLSNYE